MPRLTGLLALEAAIPSKPDLVDVTLQVLLAHAMPDLDPGTLEHGSDAVSRVAMNLAAEWVREGRLRYREDILDGIESCPDAIAGLYGGENLGKRLVRILRS